jgi:excinuclease UvrABC nuclease subunit
MGKKTVGFNKSELDKLPNDKPVVYKIKTESGNANYVGSAKRGRVQERLQEHLPRGKDYIPGYKVQIEQMDNISEARQKESNIISKNKPRYNKQGK